MIASNVGKLRLWKGCVSLAWTLRGGLWVVLHILGPEAKWEVALPLLSDDVVDHDSGSAALLCTTIAQEEWCAGAMPDSLESACNAEIADAADCCMLQTPCLWSDWRRLAALKLNS